MTDRVRRYVNSSGYLREVKDAFLRRKSAGRFLTVFPDDVFLVSYPRSGNTWARFLVASLLRPQSPVVFETIDCLIPDIYLVTDRALDRVARPRVLKSHEPFDPRYPRVVYLVRDPRDVVISRYYYALKWRAFSDDYLMEEFVGRFVPGAADLYQRTGPWGDHVLSWLAMRVGQPNFLLMRYEDLKQDTMGELARLAFFLGLEADAAALARAVESSVLERMRELDEKQPLRWLRDTRPDVPFVRKGIAGGWKSQLSEKSVRAIESAWWPLMKLLGYEPLFDCAGPQSKPLVSERFCEGLANLGLIHPVLRRSAEHPLEAPEDARNSNAKVRE